MGSVVKRTVMRAKRDKETGKVVRDPATGKPVKVAVDVWRARYRGADGREVAKDWDRKGDAATWVKKAEDAIEQGTWADPRKGSRRVSEFVDAWRAGLTVKPSTRLSYEGLLETQVLPRWGQERVGSITTAAVRSWVQTMKRQADGEPLSASRKRQALHVLAQLLEVARDEGSLALNPARDAFDGSSKRQKLPALPHHEMRTLTREQVEALADAIPEWRALVYVACYLGLRTGEITGLEVADVDVLGRRLTVRRNVVELNGKRAADVGISERLVEGSPKSGKVRTLPVPAFILTELVPLLADKGPADPVFTNTRGGRLVMSSWRRHFDRGVRAAGIATQTRGDRVRLHDCRHTAVSLWLSQGLHIKLVSSLAGHASIQITADRYGHVYGDDVEAARLAMETAHGAPGGAGAVPVRYLAEARGSR